MKRKPLWLAGIAVMLAVGCQSSVVEDGTEANPDATFEQVVLDSDRPVLVDFYATWCGPCKQMSPIIEQLKNEYEGKAVVHKVDIDKHPETAKAYGISGIPTFVFFDGGKEVDRVVGGTDKADLAARLDAAIN